MTEHPTETRDHQAERVEIGRLSDGGVAVRVGPGAQDDPALTFTRDEWVAFVAGVKNGEFDPFQPPSAADTLSSDR